MLTTRYCRRGIQLSVADVLRGWYFEWYRVHVVQLKGKEGDWNGGPIFEHLDISES